MTTSNETFFMFLFWIYSILSKGQCYSITLDGLGPSGFDLVRAASISPVECSSDKKITLESGIKYQLNYPGTPEKHDNNGTCKWVFDLPKPTTVIFRCDSFKVGLGQESGRCWGQYVHLKSPHNDSLSLCGKRDGIHLTLQGYSEYLDIDYKITDTKNGEGFSCLVYSSHRDVLNGNNLEDFDHGCECGISNEARTVVDPDAEVINNRIIGGQETKGNEFPWQVALVKKDLYKPFCGGSLISDKHVLTAAHCTKDLGSAKDVEILLGEHDLTTSLDYTYRMPVSRLIEHPLYNPLTVNNDFAILQLAEEVRFSKFVRPICLPILNEEMVKRNFSGETSTLTGWGFTTLSPEPGTDPRPFRLKKIDQTVLSQDDCQQRWTTPEAKVPITTSMICAKALDLKSSACMGDSGGPLAYKNSDGKYSVIGVVSFGPKTCVDPVIPNVYGRVTNALQWIVHYIKDSRLCVPPKTRLFAETIM